MHFRTRTRSRLVIYSYLKDSAFFQKLTETQRSKQVCERGTIYQWKVYEMGTFLSQMTYKRVRGWKSGYPPPWAILSQ